MDVNKTPFLPVLAAVLIALLLHHLGCGLLTSLTALAAAAVCWFGLIHGKGKGRFGFLKGSAVQRFENWPRYKLFPLFFLYLSISLAVFVYHDFRAPVKGFPQPENEMRAVIEDVSTTEFGDRLIVRVYGYKNRDMGLAESGGIAGVFSSLLEEASPFRLVAYAPAGLRSRGDGIVLAPEIEWTDDKLFLRSDYDELMLSRGILGTVSADSRHGGASGASGGSAAGFSIGRVLLDFMDFRGSLSDALDSSPLNEDASGLVKMLVLGDRSDCSPQLRQQFAYSGVAHVFALSGMHLSIILGIVLTLLMPLNLVISHKVRYLLAIILIWLYCMMVGMPVSTVRATIMATIMLASMIFEQKHNALNALLAAAVILILAAPSVVNDPAFQLSFFCVLCLIAYSGVWDQANGGKSSLKQKAVSFIVPMIVATLGTWSIVGYHFGIFSPWFAVTNTLILPFLPLYVTLSVIYIIFASAGFPLMLIQKILEWGAGGIVWLTGLLGGSEDNVVAVSPHIITVALSVSGVIVLGFALTWMIRHRQGAEGAEPAGKAAMRRARVLAAVSALVAVGGVASSAFISKPRELPSLVVSAGRFYPYIRIYDSEMRRIPFEKPKHRSVSWTCGGRKFVVVDNNVCNSRARKRAVVPAVPEACDFLLVYEGYRGGIKDLLMHYDPVVIVECRMRVDGMPIPQELKMHPMEDYPQIMQVGHDDNLIIRFAEMEDSVQVNVLESRLQSSP